MIVLNHEIRDDKNNSCKLALVVSIFVCPGFHTKSHSNLCTGIKTLSKSFLKIFYFNPIQLQRVMAV